MLYIIVQYLVISLFFQNKKAVINDTISVNEVDSLLLSGGFTLKFSF